MSTQHTQPEADRSQHTQPPPDGGDASVPPAAEASQTPEAKPTRILLVRHGVNDYVKQGLLAGRTPGVHLNDEGRAQAVALAERLASEPIVAIYSSPLERCVETAAPLARRLDIEPMIVDDIIETGCGEWTGQALEALRQDPAWQQVQISPSSFRFPNGESMLEVQARMVAALQRLAQRHAGELIVLVSHSDPIKEAVAFHVGMPLDAFQRLEVSPASITELVFNSFHVRLARLNDTAHVPNCVL